MLEQTLRYLACEKKKSYPSENHARRFLKKAAKAGIIITQKPYKCKFCPKFHVGHPKEISRLTQ